ncbi:hypothetical protein [Enterocloster bolteae]|nr:hypothetical protein [Enterocloster bolteae]
MKVSKAQGAYLIYKPPDTVQGMETMDPLFPVTMPGDETMMQEGTASD